MTTLNALRERITRLLYGDPWYCAPRPGIVQGAITRDELRAAFDECFASVMGKPGQVLLYCPRCAQHLPSLVFAGHTATVWTKYDQWPPNDGFTADSIEYMGRLAPCPGGKR